MAPARPPSWTITSRAVSQYRLPASTLLSTWRPTRRGTTFSSTASAMRNRRCSHRKRTCFSVGIRARMCFSTRTDKLFTSGDRQRALLENLCSARYVFPSRPRMAKRFCSSRRKGNPPFSGNSMSPRAERGGFSHHRLVLEKAASPEPLTVARARGLRAKESAGSRDKERVGQKIVQGPNRA